MKFNPSTSPSTPSSGPRGSKQIPSIKLGTNVPDEIKDISKKLQKAGHKAYLVGGCVRDILIKREPKDWDITTDAKPEKIQKLFSTFAGATADKPATVYENKFGTVGIKTKSENPRLKVIEITTFRLEGKYTDKRHPNEIKFAKTVEEDLSRRDFTINAIALKVIDVVNVQNVVDVKKKQLQQAERSNKRSDQSNTTSELVDPFNGKKDIENKIIRTVGEPKERFNEDALRLMRAVRFATELDFSIEEKTSKAIKKEAGLLEIIAKERILDELEKIIMSDHAKDGVQNLENLGLLKYIIPELREGIDVGQNKHHIYTVWEHNLRALDYTAKNNYSLEVRIASLLHDVGKPKTKVGDGPDSTFYNHEIVGAKMTVRILDRLHFSKSVAEKIIHLVRFHLFYYNVGEVTEAGVRRFLRRVGPENVADFIKVREADRIGSGVPKAIPYKIRHLLFMIEKVKRDPISPKMLTVNGEDVIKILGIEPGPKIGQILSILLDEVIEEPKKNTKKNLEFRIQDLGKLSDAELKKLSKAAREKKEEFEFGIEEEIKKKFYVK
ncbi:MAG TPA: HDIG domain-containing protein [Candidatus Wolfebacteria bacterium]|nr:HDIG domain-containing protein [Candidatus Wolfebacteria bacterium]